MDEPALPDHIALRQPSDLPFADQMHRLITVNRPHCPFCRSEPQTCGDPLLNESMILLDDVVQVRRGPTATLRIEFARLLQFGNGASIGGVSIHMITWGWIPPVPDNASRRNSLAAIKSRFGDNIKIDGLASRIHRPVKIRPRSGDPHI